jgi:Flp pilus assembly pilin Flp
MNNFFKFISSEDGATIAEYAMIISLITVVIATTVSAFRGQLGNQFTQVGTALEQ